MGTEVAISFSSLRAQLENEKSSLCKIDENIKKIVQTPARFLNDRYNNSTGDYTRGGPRLGGRHSFPEGSNNYKHDDPLGKRKHETKTVFSRLSARAMSDDEEDGVGVKRARVSSAVSRELPTRAAVLRAQAGDEQARTRNRRIFGSLLGTLQKFKQEEIVLQTKEEKKAQVERKIEEQARQQKEKEIKERKTLFAERDLKKNTIKALEAKMARVQEFEKWEASQKCLGNFILTKAKPHVYWLPKKMEEKATEKLISSRQFHETYMNQKRQELQEELVRIENRCLRPRGPRDMSHYYNQNKDKPPTEEQAPGSKRDKFATDIDKAERDDSDADDRHDEIKPKEEKESDDSKLDTTLNTTIEPEGPKVPPKVSSEFELNGSKQDSSLDEESTQQDASMIEERAQDESTANGMQENTMEVESAQQTSMDVDNTLQNSNIDVQDTEKENISDHS